MFKCIQIKVYNQAITDPFADSQKNFYGPSFS